jgi:hypothetical protein
MSAGPIRPFAEGSKAPWINALIAHQCVFIGILEKQTHFVAVDLIRVACGWQSHSQEPQDGFADGANSSGRSAQIFYLFIC